MRALAVLERAVRRLPIDGGGAELGHRLDEGALGLVEDVRSVVAEHDGADGDPPHDERRRGEREVVARQAERPRPRPLGRDSSGVST